MTRDREKWSRRSRGRAYAYLISSRATRTSSDRETLIDKIVAMARKRPRKGTSVTYFRVDGEEFAVLAVAAAPALPDALTSAERAVVSWSWPASRTRRSLARAAFRFARSQTKSRRSCASSASDRARHSSRSWRRRTDHSDGRRAITASISAARVRRPSLVAAVPRCSAIVDGDRPSSYAISLFEWPSAA